jgi:hypothetical protein
MSIVSAVVLCRTVVLTGLSASRRRYFLSRSASRTRVTMRHAHDPRQTPLPPVNAAAQARLHNLETAIRTDLDPRKAYNDMTSQDPQLR